MFEKDEAKITDKMGLILKGIRLQKGFSREIIAERAKIGVRHLAAIENEQRAPSIEVFCRIMRALGVPWRYPGHGKVKRRKALRRLRLWDFP